MKRKRQTLMDRAIEAENRLTMGRHGNWMGNNYSNGFVAGYRACQADARRKNRLSARLLAEREAGLKAKARRK